MYQINSSTAVHAGRSTSMLLAIPAAVLLSWGSSASADSACPTPTAGPSASASLVGSQPTEPATSAPAPQHQQQPGAMVPVALAGCTPSTGPARPAASASSSGAPRPHRPAEAPQLKPVRTAQVAVPAHTRSPRAGAAATTNRPSLVPPPDIAGADGNPTPAVEGPLFSRAYGRSLIFSGTFGLVVSLAGVALVGQRRRRW